MTQFIRYPLPVQTTPVGTQIYVSPSGTDSAGRGGPLAPYLTYTYAKSQITDAGASNPYVINILPGLYTEATFLLAPYISVCGSGQETTIITVSAPNVRLDTTWEGATSAIFVKDVQFIGGGSFDGTAFTTANATIGFYDVTFSGNVAASTNPATFIYYAANCTFANVTLNSVLFYDQGSVIINANLDTDYAACYLQAIGSHISALDIDTNGSFSGQAYIAGGERLGTIDVDGSSALATVDTATYINPVMTNDAQVVVVNGILNRTETTTSGLLKPNNFVIADNASLVTLTMPSTASVGDTIQVVYKGAGGWKIAQPASVSIQIGNVATTVGTGGSLQYTAAGDCVTMKCITANTLWSVMSMVGNITVV